MLTYSTEPLCDSITTKDPFSISTGDGKSYLADCKGVIDHVYEKDGTYTARYFRNGKEIAHVTVTISN
jgi:hypothetical protein